jgi:hypothetical protein
VFLREHSPAENIKDPSFCAKRSSRIDVLALVAEQPLVAASRLRDRLSPVLGR